MPKRNPVVSDREVYEIKKLRWKQQLDGNYCTSGLFGSECILRVNMMWTFAGEDYATLREAKQAAENEYRQQLRKALRRVRL